MRRLLIAFVGSVAGFIVFAVGGYVAVEKLSSNTHDRSVEAAMTAFFIAAPMGAVIGGIIGVALMRRASRVTDQ